LAINTPMKNHIVKRTSSFITRNSIDDGSHFVYILQYVHGY